jgi:hypothetical protein
LLVVTRGYGLVVVGFAVLAMIAATLVSPAGDPDSVTALMGAFLVPAGIATWFIGKDLNRKATRQLVDPKTGEDVVVRTDHSAFFLPLEWWGPMMAAFGIVLMIVFGSVWLVTTLAQH